MLAFSQKVLIVLNKHKTCRICTDEQCRAHHQLFASHDFVTDAAECGGSVIPDPAQIARKRGPLVSWTLDIELQALCEKRHRRHRPVRVDE